MNTIRFMFVVMLSLLFLSPASWAVDPNVNTQSANVRSNGSDGKPGFDPCLGGTRDTNGICGGAGLNLNALLNPTTTLTLFGKLGPGAVTDNMFGIIEKPVDPNACGEEGDIGINSVGLNRLNCGDVRFGPETQGQTGLTGLNTLTTSLPVNMNNSLVADFCANGASDCPDSGSAQKEAAHVGFNFVNNFNWNRTSGTLANVVSSQTMEQVTAVKTTGIGTFGTPGTGDQHVRITNDFTVSASNNPSVFPPTLVTWTQLIEDPDQSGVGSGKFSQTIAGTFTYNEVGLFPIVHYPFGQSQTNQNITSANLP